MDSYILFCLLMLSPFWLMGLMLVFLVHLLNRRITYAPVRALNLAFIASLFIPFHMNPTHGADLPEQLIVELLGCLRSGKWGDLHFGFPIVVFVTVYLGMLIQSRFTDKSRVDV